MRSGPPRWKMAAAIMTAATVVTANTLACASAGRPPLVGPPREQRSSLVGRWAAEADTAQSNGVERRWLILLADGLQWTERAQDGTAAGVPERDSPRAWWWVYRGVNGAADQLCLHWRAGRHRADCAAYQLDTVWVAGRAVPRLRWKASVWLATR